MVESYDVFITEKAKESLVATTKYLTESVSESTAEHVYFGILDAIDTLAKMPTGYPIERNITNDARTFRYKLKWKYRIVFYVNEDKERVEIMDVVHSSRDLKTYFERQDYD